MTAQADRLQEIGRTPNLPLLYAVALLAALVVGLLVAKALLFGPARRD